MSGKQEDLIWKLIEQKRGAQHEIAHLSKKFGIPKNEALNIEQASIVIGVLLKLPDKN